MDDFDEFFLVSFSHGVMAVGLMVVDCIWRVIQLNWMLPIHWSYRILVKLLALESSLGCVHLISSLYLLISLGLTDSKFILDAFQNEIELLKIWHRVLLEHLQVALVLVGLQYPVHDKLIALISKFNLIVFFNSAQNP